MNQEQSMLNAKTSVKNLIADKLGEKKWLGIFLILGCCSAREKMPENQFFDACKPLLKKELKELRECSEENLIQSLWEISLTKIDGAECPAEIRQWFVAQGFPQLKEDAFYSEIK